MAKAMDEIKWQDLEDGAVVVETGSAREYETGTWRSERPVVDKSKCVKCGLCWIYCPDMSIMETEDGYLVADLTYCKGCGICARECPVGCISMVGEEEE